jgi:hypothetical protein
MFVGTLMFMEVSEANLCKISMNTKKFILR